MKNSRLWKKTQCYGVGLTQSDSIKKCLLKAISRSSRLHQRVIWPTTVECASMFLVLKNIQGH